MAVEKSIIKNSDTETVIKVSGSSGTATIDLSVDLIHSSQVVDGNTQTVNIIAVNWTGEVANLIYITRNNVRVMTLNSGAAGMLYFDGQQMPPESTANTYDIVVEMAGTGVGEIWIKLRKVSGYKSKVEYWKYGAYDDESKVGALNTSGSPDYTG